MNVTTKYSDTITDEGIYCEPEIQARDWRRQTIFSTSSEISTTYESNNNGTLNQNKVNNVRNRNLTTKSEKPKRRRQGFSGQWAPEFERIYPKPVDLDKTLGKAFREAQFYSQGWGYMSGGQWFNPFSLRPHPVLEQKMDYASRLGTFGFPGVTSFDAYLKIYGMMSDSTEKVTKFHMSNGGHMGLNLDFAPGTINGGSKQNSYFNRNLVIEVSNISSADRDKPWHTTQSAVVAVKNDLNAIKRVASSQNGLGNLRPEGKESAGHKIVVTKRSLSDDRCKRRRFYCLLVNLFLLFNILRFSACHFMNAAVPRLTDAVDGGRPDVKPFENWIRGQGMRPPKGFGGLGVNDGPPDVFMRFAWGDLSPFWTRRPHMVTVVVIVLTCLALIINLFFEYYQQDKQKRWMVPFSVLTGQITPAEARIRSKHQLEKMEQNVRHSFRLALVMTIIWTVLWSGFYFWSALNFTEVPETLVEDVKNGLIYARTKNRTTLIQHITEKKKRGDKMDIATIMDMDVNLVKLGSYKISLFWAAINSLNAFFATGIIIWAFTYFHVVTWYIRIRFKRLNKIVYALLDVSNGIIPLAKRNDFMAEVLHEHNLTSADMTIYNRFWKWYLLICHFFFVPIIFWLVYIVTFYWQGTWMIKVPASVVALQFGLLMGLMVASGESVSNQAHLNWRWLNTLCLYEWPIVIKFRMAYLIERLGGPTLGFTCYDFFVVARETFYEMALLLGTYFFLTYEFVLSSL